MKISVTGVEGAVRAWEKWPREMKVLVDRWLRLSTALVAGKAKKLAPKGAEGRLTAGITANVDSSNSVGTVFVPANQVPYAAAIARGRRPGAHGPPHLVGGQANRALLLWARKKGRHVGNDPADLFPLARAIHRRGIKANPFLQKALASSEEKILEILRNGLQSLAQRMAVRGGE